MNERPRFRAGWIHRAERPGGVGLVIVPPFGFEEICAHRSLRALANAAAAAGVTAVRVDLDGTGDSDGDDLESGRVEAWLASIDDACELARGPGGCDRLVVCGVRLGSALAAIVAARRADVVGYVAIAGAPKPKALLRQLYALQVQLALAPAPDGEPAGDVEPKEEVCGFALTRETRAALTAIDLIAAPAPPAKRVLLVDRDDQKGNDDWAAAMRATGAASVDVIRPPGYLEMMADPHLAVPPAAIIDAVVAFAAASPPAVAAPAARPVWVATRVLGDGFEEECVRIDGVMTGVVTRPLAPAKAARALLLFSAGGTHHIGPNRMYVTLARRLAREGIAVARIDQSGIGDADVRPGARDNIVYADAGVPDLQAAIAFVKRTVAGKLAVAGLCSGAFHALRGALDETSGAGVELAIPINAPIFHYVPGKPHDFGPTFAASETQRYKRAMSEGGSWKKLLRGDVDMRNAARAVTRRARDTAQAWAKELARKAKLPLPHDFASQLRGFTERGGVVRFVFSADDAGRILLAQQGGATLERLVANHQVALTSIPGADHTFTARWTQRRVLDELVRVITAR